MSDPVEEEAARWALRDTPDQRQRRELEAWLASDPRHAGALLRAQAALSCIDRALVPDFYLARSEIPSPGGISRRWALASLGGVAAAAVAGVLGWPLLRGERVATMKGEIRRLPLADGSVATIDTDSELHLNMSGTTRRIDLDRGQAWFQVAKDRQRPFVVDAGIAEVRAVGTAFAVRRSHSYVQISVTEGMVVAWPGGAAGTTSVLTQGQYANFRVDGGAPVIGTDPDAIRRLLAWRDGEISLEGQTLGTAIAEFNRYNRQQLVLVDPALGAERLVGLFRLGNPLDFAVMVSKSLGLSVVVTPAEIRIARKKSLPV